MTTRTDLIKQIETLLNQSKLPAKDQVNALAQVMIDVGLAIEPSLYKSPLTTSDLKQIEKAYYESPTLAKALILQGAMMLTWAP